MKPEFKTYLESIGMGELFAEKAENVYQFYSEILKIRDDEIIDIFVTDYIQQDESRQYENLWFFSKKYFMEAKMFLNKDDFDFMRYADKTEYSQIEKQNYDFKQATKDSRLVVKYYTNNKLSGTLRASRENCDKLRDIFIKYLVPPQK